VLENSIKELQQESNILFDHNKSPSLLKRLSNLSDDLQKEAYVKIKE
jgi:hypothetical protein